MVRQEIAAGETTRQLTLKMTKKQLKQIAKLIQSIQVQLQKLTPSFPFGKKAVPAERSEEFQNWVSQLSKSNTSLPDEAFDRDNIYD